MQDSLIAKSVLHHPWMSIVTILPVVVKVVVNVIYVEMVG